jgi:hypothetical protein
VDGEGPQSLGVDNSAAWAAHQGQPLSYRCAAM